MKKMLIIFCCMFLIAFSSTAKATSVSFDLSMEFSGATPPAGTPPWLRATFLDSGNSVTLTMEAINLTGEEFVTEWMFNLDPSMDPDKLVFSSPTKTGTFDDPIITTGVNAFRPDGDGFFDIQFIFANNPLQFGANEAVEYTITYDPDNVNLVNPEDFNFLSALGPGGSPGPLPTAAHIQGIDPDGEESGWVTVIPEPLTMAGVFLGIGGLGGYIRKRKRSNA